MTENTVSYQHLMAFREVLVREEKSPATVEKYLRDARVFAAYVADREITKELTLHYKQELQQRQYSLRSVNSMLAALNRLLEFLGRGDCRVRALRCQRQIYCAPEKELTKAEYMRLVEASKGQKQLNLVIQTICGTGIRISELKCFTLEEVRRGEVTVRCKNKTRVILLPGKLRRLLLEYARGQGIRTGCIFVTKGGNPLDRSNIWAQMKRLCVGAGVAPGKVFPHNLRKLFARTFYGLEKDIAKLADILGHSSIDTTRIYIMTSGAEHRKKIERLGLVI